MRLPIQSWSNTLRRFGKKAVHKPRKKLSRRPYLETLEERRVLTEFAYLGEAVTTCTPGCECSCQQADASNGGGAKANAGPVSYNSQSQSHPVMMFGIAIDSYPGSPYNPWGHTMARMEVDLTVGGTQLNTIYFGAPSSQWSVFGVQIDASAMSSGLYDWQFVFRLYDETDDMYYSNALYPYSSSLTNPLYQPLQVVNHDDSPYGAGWSMIEDQRLMIQDGSSGGPAGVALVTGSDELIFFSGSGGSYTRVGNQYDFSELAKQLNGVEDADDTYTLTSPDGTVRTFDYQGLLKAIEDRNGNETTYTYGTGSKIEEIEYASGRRTRFDYSSNLMTVKDFYLTAGEQTTQYVYSGNKLIKMIQPDPDGAGPLTSPTTTYDYNADGLLKSIIDPRGLETTIAYDNFRRVDLITERCGGVINVDSLPSKVAFDRATVGYDVNHPAQLKPYHNAWYQFVNPTYYSFDNIEQLFNGELYINGGLYNDPKYEKRNVFGEETKIIRDRFGNVQYMQDVNGTVTEYRYDSNGLPSQMIQRDPNNPSGTLTTYYTYNSNGQITGISHPIGYESWTYGAFGQVTSYTDPTYNFTWYDIDSGTGNVLSMTQVVGYDDRYSSENDDVATYYTYTTVSDGTLLGLVETITDPNGNVTHYTYNAQGLVETVVSAEGTPDESTVSYDYDSRDRVSAMIDGLGRRTDYTYDNLDRLVTRTEADPDGNGPQTRPVWTFRYDQVGNQTHVTDPLGRVTETVYDSRGRVFQTIQPVADPAVTPAVTTKDSTQYTSETGTWSNISPSGAYGGTVRASSTDGASTTYAFTGLTATKKYAVQVRWVPSGNPDDYDKNALFEVFGNTGGTALNELRVNLNSKTEGMPDGSGYMWLSLGAFSPYSNSLTVKLRDDDAGGSGKQGKLVIDAVRLVEVGPVTESKFDCNGNLVKSIDALGNATSYAYDELNRLVTTTEPNAGSGSPVTQYFYNSLGWMTSMIDAEENGTIYQYDSMGRQTKQIDLLGAGLTGTYVNGSGTTVQVDSQINFGTTGGALNGYSSVTWTGAIYIDDAGEIDFYLENTDYAQLYLDEYFVMSNTSSSGMDESDPTTVKLVAGWHTIRVEFTDGWSSGNNGLIVKYDPVVGGKQTIPGTVFGTTQVTSTTMYDSAGRVERSLDALNRGTFYDYDDLSRVEYAYDVYNVYSYAGPSLHYEYDGVGNVLSSTDALGHSTLHAYDALNRQSQVIQPDADNTTVHDLLDETDAELTDELTDWVNGPATNSSAYNSDLLVASELGASAKFTFDTLDNDKTYAVLVHWAGDSTDPDAYDTDALFKVYAGTSPTNVVHESQQNLNLPLQGVYSSYSGYTWKVLGAFHPVSGELSLVISDDNNNGYLAIDAVQLLEVGGATSYAYDDASQLTSLTDPVGNTSRWVYDGLGRTIEETNELNATRYYSYDAVGNATRMIDRNGRITRYEYDRLNRQTEETWQEDGVGDKVKSRYAFYPNHAGSADSNIAVDENDYPKQALLPGETATIANNVGGYLTGLIIDLVDVGTLTSGDFEFKTTSVSSPGTWTTYSPTLSFNVRPGEGKDGSDRVEITGLYVLDKWLQVTVKATANTNLATPDVFYFSTKEGDGDGDGDSDGADFVVWQTNFPAGSGHTWETGDFDGDGDVDGPDYLSLFGNPVSYITAAADTERTIGHSYDALGRLTYVNDRDGSNNPASADYSYFYDNLSRLTYQTQQLVGLTPQIEFDFSHDLLGRRTMLDTNFGGSATDFLNVYTYDALGRLTSVSQTDTIAHVVAQKYVGFGYYADGQNAWMQRFDYVGGSAQTSSYSSFYYDNAGRLSTLIHHKVSLEVIANYGYTWDNANRLTDFNNSAHSGENVDYSYDNSGQVTGANYATQGDEAYAYDENGNRETANGDTYTTGANNRLEDDGTYSYEYDGEGNLVKRVNLNYDFSTVYEWDHRNRLVSVSEYDDSDVLFQKVTYLYDAFDRLIGKRVDSDGDTDLDATEAYIYDGNQIVLRFADDDASALADSDLANRYLWGPNVDQLLAEENVTSLGSAGTVEWAIWDHQNTIRDWVSYSGGVTTVADHAEYDSFGNRLDSPTVDSIFGYTGRIRDAETGLQWNGSAQGGGRWYDTGTGRWLSEDSIGFGGDPSNLYRYVGNGSTIYVDPSGLETIYNVPKSNPGRPSKKNTGNGCIEIEGGAVVDRAEEIARRGCLANPDFFGSESNTIEDASNGLKLINQCRGCIKTLVMHGHGAPGRQYVGPADNIDLPINTLPPKDPYRVLTTDNVDQLFGGVSFCKPCTIKLYGCSVGEGAKGYDLMKAIHELTGCKVEAFAGTSSPLDNGGAYGPIRVYPLPPTPPPAIPWPLMPLM